MKQSTLQEKAPIKSGNDIRQIKYEQSGKIETEYQMRRIGKHQFVTPWYPAEKIFALPDDLGEGR